MSCRITYQDIIKNINTSVAETAVNSGLFEKVAENRLIPVQNKELALSALQYINELKGEGFKTMLNSDPLGTLRFVADQYYGRTEGGDVSNLLGSPEDEAREDVVTKGFGENIVSLARKIFPLRGSEEHRGIISGINSTYNEAVVKFTGAVYEISLSEDVINSLLQQANKDQSSEANINFQFRSVQILSSDRAINWFKKNQALAAKFPDVFWTKMQADLQIPKEQVNLLQSLQTTDRNELITSFLSLYSYPIQINTVMMGDEIGEEPDLIYSNMTVLGGTNYQNNEIAIPDITPAIRGHAQFSTPHGIGWFRSDDQAPTQMAGEYSDRYNQAQEDRASGNISNSEAERIINEEVKPIDNRIRRVLEIQSDLFQKGRGKENLVELTNQRKYNAITGWAEEPVIRQPEPEESIRRNQFLQLLNKDNNWVSFFVKSIIQDSAKKGYEKILFPVGDTAAKVEGHQTLEDFKKFRKEQIAKIKEELTPEGLEEHWKKIIDSHKKQLYNIITHQKPKQVSLQDDPEDFYISPSITGTTKNFSRIRKNNDGVIPMDLVGDPNYNGWVLQNYTVGEDNPIIKISNERAKELLDKDNKLKLSLYEKSVEEQEFSIKKLTENKDTFIATHEDWSNAQLEQYERELKEAQDGTLKIGAIHTFYETTVFNILKKQGYSPIRIEDEYKNGWYEVEIKPEYLQTIRFGNPFVEERNSYDPEQMYSEAGISEEDTPYEYMQKYSPDKKQIEKFIKANPGVTMSFTDGYSEFDPNTNHIMLSLQELYGVSQKSGIPFKTVINSFLLHEMAHAASLYALQKGTNDMFVQELLDTTKAFHKTSPFEDELRQGILEDGLPYAFKDIHEFVADAFANPYFQAYLKKVPYKSSTIWGKLLDWIYSLFGAVRNNVYNQIIDYINSDRIRQDNEEGSIAPQYQGMYLTYKGNPRDYMSAAYKSFTSSTIATQVNEIFAQLPSAVAKLKAISKAQNDKEQTRRIQSLLDAYNDVKGQEKVIPVYINMLVTAANITKDLNDQLNAADKIKDDVEKIHMLNSLLTSASNLQFMAPLVKDLLTIMEQDGYHATFTRDEREAYDKFMTQLRGIISVESSVKQKFTKFVTPSLLSYYSSLYPENLKAQEIRAKIAELNEKIEDSTRNKDKDFYEDQIKKYEKVLLNIPSSAAFEKIFAGQHSDAISMQMWVEPAAINSHPLVATTKALLDNVDISTTQEMLNIENSHQRKFSAIRKAKNPGMRNPFKTWEPIRDIVNDVDHWELDEQGNPKAVYMPRYMHLSSYTPEYLQKHFEFRSLRDFNYDKFLESRRKANEIDEDKYYALYISVVKDRQTFEKENSERRYKDEVYDMYNLLDQEITKEDGSKTSFRREQGDIFHEIENLERQRDRATTLEDVAEHQDQIKQKNTELKDLRSTYDKLGVPKAGSALEIANIANQYYKLKYEYGSSVLTPEGQASFDREILSLKDKLAKNIINQAQYDAKINSITVTELEDEYYQKISEFSELIARATAEIASVPALSAIMKGVNKDAIKNGYAKIKDLTKAFRDNNGVVDGQLFSRVKPELVKEIKNIQQELENLKNKASKLKGLSTEDSILYDELLTKIADKSITTDEQAQFDALKTERLAKRTAYKNNKSLIDNYYGLLANMAALIEGSVTEYYQDELSEQLNKIIAGQKKDIRKQVLSSNILEEGKYVKRDDEWWQMIGKNEATGEEQFGKIPNTDDYSSEDYITDAIAKSRAQNILEDSDWWKDNHYTYYAWDNEKRSYYPLEKPIYIWTKTEPKNKEYIKAGQPSFAFKTYRVNDEMINQNFREIYPFIPINKAGKYDNKRYENLDKTWKDYLEFLREEQNKAQAFYPVEKRIGDLYPGIVKSKDELKVEGVNKIISGKNPLKGLSEFIIGAKEEDDSNLLLGGSQSNISSQQKILPTRFVGRVNAKKQSADIPGMVLALTVGAVKYNKLLEVQPIIEATRTVLETLPVQESANIARQFNLRNMFSTVKSVNKTLTREKQTEKSNLAKTVDFVADTFLYGQTKDKSVAQILGMNVDLQKVSSSFKHLSSFAIFSGNTFLAIKNTLSAKVQSVINSNVTSGFYTNIDLAAANWETKNYIKDHVSDYKLFGNKSLIGQKLAYFQVLRGPAYDAYGRKTQWTELKNATNYLSVIKNISEFELQVTQFLAMSRANKVLVGDKKVDFDKAFILNKNGDLEKLPGAQITQEQIIAFIKKVKWINRNINGAYRADESNKAQKSVLGGLAFYLNGYVMPGILNRYDSMRYAIEADTITRGYWNQGMSFIKDLVKYRRGIATQWTDLNADEKNRVMRFTKEIAFIIGFAILVSQIGGGDDKEDLKKNAALQNYMLALAMSVKSETETFAPLPSMGLNELSRKINSPFAALRQVTNIIKTLENGFGYAMHSVDSDWYKKSVYQQQGVHDGFHDKGDPKVVANFMKLFFGWTGAAGDPVQRVIRGRQIQQLR